MNLPWDSKARQEGQDKSWNWQHSDPRYHTTRWYKLSTRWRIAHPLCEECRKRGVIKPAELVDHIIPVPVCKDFFDESNLQSLCRDCNNAKGQRDKAIIQKWRREQETGGGSNL